jgi:hypothetical protein
MNVEKYRPTLLIDEADTFLGDHDELRGIINSGHRRSSAFVLRCDGDDQEPKSLSTWCPKAIALIGLGDPHVVLRRLGVGCLLGHLFDLQRRVQGFLASSGPHQET